MTALKSAALPCLCWAVLLALAPVARPADLPPAGAGAPEEQEFVGRVNAEREGRGLPALAVDALLTATARAHCGEMDARGYFSHRSPAPGLATPLARTLAGLRESGVPPPCALIVGENIYYCSVSSDIYNVDYGHRALMNSPGHRAIILDPRFSRVGVGVHRDARGRFWVTELFWGEWRRPEGGAPSPRHSGRGESRGIMPFSRRLTRRPTRPAG